MVPPEWPRGRTHVSIPAPVHKALPVATTPTPGRRGISSAHEGVPSLLTTLIDPGDAIAVHCPDYLPRARTPPSPETSSGIPFPADPQSQRLSSTDTSMTDASICAGTASSCFARIRSSRARSGACQTVTGRLARRRRPRCLLARRGCRQPPPGDQPTPQLHRTHAHARGRDNALGDLVPTASASNPSDAPAGAAPGSTRIPEALIGPASLHRLCRWRDEGGVQADADLGGPYRAIRFPAARPPARSKPLAPRQLRPERRRHLQPQRLFLLR